MSTKKIITIVACCIIGCIVVGGIIVALSFGVGLQFKKAAPAIKERVKANIMEGIPAQRGALQPAASLSAAEYKILQDEINLFNKEGWPNFEQLKKRIQLYWLKYKKLPESAAWVKEAGINFPGGKWNATYFEHTGTDFVYQNVCSGEGSYITLARYNKQGLIYEVNYMIRPSEGKSLSSCEPRNKIGLAFCQGLAAQNGWEHFSTGFGLFEPLP